jgi:hypothetical protein
MTALIIQQAVSYHVILVILSMTVVFPPSACGHTHRRQCAGAQFNADAVGMCLDGTAVCICACSSADLSDTEGKSQTAQSRQQMPTAWQGCSLLQHELTSVVTLDIAASCPHYLHDHLLS